MTRTLRIKREVLTELTPEHLVAVRAATGTPQIQQLLADIANHTCDEHCTAISKGRLLDRVI